MAAVSRERRGSSLHDMVTEGWQKISTKRNLGAAVLALTDDHDASKILQVLIVQNLTHSANFLFYFSKARVLALVYPSLSQSVVSYFS